MSSAAATMDSPEALRFAHSNSQTTGVQVGWADRLRDMNLQEKKWERDNAPRIISVLKFGADLALGFSGNPLLIGYTVLAGTGRLISFAYGGKSHQKKLAEEKAQGKHQDLLGDSWMDSVHKVSQPRRYPVESAAGLSTIGETLGIAYGIQQFAKGATGFTPIMMGLIGVWSYANIVFTKEKSKDDPAAKEPQRLFFTVSKSKITGTHGGFLDKIKSNPVLMSSLVNLGICVGMIVGGSLEGNMPYVIAGCIYFVANSMQALFVRKKEFNVEGAGQNQNKQEDASFQNRLEQQRSRDEGPALKPA